MKYEADQSFTRDFREYVRSPVHKELYIRAILQSTGNDLLPMDVEKAGDRMVCDCFLGKRTVANEFS